MVAQVRAMWRPGINGDSERGQFLIIMNIIKLILLKIRVRTVKFQIYEWQRVTVSDAFH
jgi:hypothetical protein